MEVRLRNRHRRGNYAILLLLCMVVPLGFGALAVDTSYIRLSQAQLQDVADASSQTALFILRRTGDTNLATEAAQAVIERNPVGGRPAELAEITYGIWEDGGFVLDNEAPNAVRVRASRADENALGLLLARTLGYESVDIAAEAVSAIPDLHIALVMDITGSWAWADFQDAREAAVVFFDNIANAHGPNDRIGMVTFLNVYGYEHTPLTLVENAVAGTVRANWMNLGLASMAGYRDNGYTDPFWRHPCRYNVMNLATILQYDNFNYPNPAGRGGCFPNMPRWYTDEMGTDHSTGVAMAQRMFEERDDPGVYRAMVVLTDGRPDPVQGNSGQARSSQGFTERRWRFYQGPKHGVGQIRRETQNLTQAMWDDMRVNTWMVSFVEDEPWLHSVPKGDGYFMLADRSQDLIDIFDEISNSLPMAVVQ